MVITPVLATLATALPEMLPNSALATTAAFAGPPRYLPMVACASFRKISPPPVTNSICPNRMKANTTMIAMRSGAPNRESVPRNSRLISRSQPRPVVARGPVNMSPKRP